ncbi:MAG TPA: diguanylate cyclase [Gemmatimonadales bacterium]
MTRWEQTTSKLLQVLRLETIRSKLLAFAVLASLIPSVSTGWLSYVQNKRALTEKSGQELQNAGSQAARELDLWIKERLYDLRVFASSYEVSENLARLPLGSGTPVRSQVQGRLSDYLNSVRERFQDYEELLVLDPQGQVVASSSKSHGTIYLAAGWQDDIQNDRPVVGVPHWDDSLNKPVMVVAVPIRRTDGPLLGALSARLSLERADNILRRFAPGDSGQVYLIGANANVITSAQASSGTVMAQRLAKEALDRLSATEGAAVEYQNYDGNEVVGTLNSIPGLGWSVVAEIPSTEAFRQVNRLRNLTILMVLALLVGVGLIAWLLGLLIVRPLTRLAQGAAEVATGSLAVDLPEVGGGEVGDLTRVFNNMVDRLRESREELERLSTLDGLTGLANRRHLLSRLALESSRAKRGHHSFAVLMVDVDNFKAYNDSYGHLAGDEVLVRLAEIMRECCREVDCAARYGGEEFLVLLTETGMEGAVEVAERVRARLASETFAGGRITLSVGVASYPEFGESPEAVIMSADVALYQAKHLGRDRVVMASLNKVED